MKQLTEDEVKAYKAELKDVRKEAANIGITSVRERNIQNAEGDVLIFKGEKVSDFFGPVTSGSIKYLAFTATNGQQISESAICALKNNGLGLDGGTPEERCDNFIKEILESENEGITIRIARMKVIPTRRIGECMKQMLFERP